MKEPMHLQQQHAHHNDPYIPRILYTNIYTWLKQLNYQIEVLSMVGS